MSAFGHLNQERELADGEKGYWNDRENDNRNGDQDNRSWRIKYNAAPKDAIIVMMVKNKVVSPKINFVGKDLRKSFSAYRAVRIPKNINSNVDALNINSALETIKIKNGRGWDSNIVGRPVLSFLLPPGTVNAVVNIIAAMRVPTIMLDPAMLFIQLSASPTSCLCSSVNKIWGVLLFSFTSSFELGLNDALDFLYEYNDITN
ncbi:UNVERIFIED_CONTAM: hypothetical protein Slati_0168600 [Sesamum latifolium]|uniref:Uncharacterized protein n=1 Tax=Sesamum latifolium TaxID=2727402 RepID=A0AAW2YBG5_9LAMI